ncbi:hypothetical protein [Caminibacter sp.]
MENVKWKILIVFLLFFAGCSTKTTPVYAVFNTPDIKVADQGFLKEGLGYKKIVIYKAGMAPVSVTIKNSVICLDSRCMDKEKFLKSIDKNYPVDLLDRIIEREPISICGKISKTKDGFIQKNERFFYRVSKNSVLFKDRQKRVVIMIKYLRERV